MNSSLFKHLALVLSLGAVSVAGAAPESNDDILVNKPDYYVFRPGRPRGVAQTDKTQPSDTYNDHFHVFWDAPRKLFYAFWTQAGVEADPSQHICFSKSADRGKTWTKPVILAGSPCAARPGLVASWQQVMITRKGRIYCLWNQQTTSAGPHVGDMFGFYSDDAGETWSAPKKVALPRCDLDPKDVTVPPSWCNWQPPQRFMPDGRFLVGASRHGKAPYDDREGCKVEFWEFANMDDNPDVNKITVIAHSTNRDMLHIDESVPGTFKAKYGPAVEEAAIVKLPDGRLFAITRSSVGHPLWTQSRDGGVTWSPVKVLKDAEGKPFLHCRSPLPFFDWKGNEAGSGTYFALIHNTFDFKNPMAYQTRGPLYLIAGKFDPEGEQPVKFSAPKLFAPRPDSNSFYASYTCVDGEGVLWFNDCKFYLLGRKIGPEWFGQNP